jgi:hypothetical protein
MDPRVGRDKMIKGIGATNKRWRDGNGQIGVIPKELTEAHI